jgi:hypothetical protein
VVVPNDVEVLEGPRRRHVASLAEVDVDALRAIHEQLSGQLDAVVSDRS